MSEQQAPILERIIGVISPTWALNRARAAGQLEMMVSLRKYAGASRGPLTEDWITHSTSASSEIGADYRKLRDRMRELVRNDGFAFAAVEAIANNVVGKGIQPAVSGPETLKDKVERLFTSWCENLVSDFTGRQNFFGVQQLIMKSIATSGDVLVVKRYTGKGKDTQLALQVLETDYIVDTYHEQNPKGFSKGTYVENGIYFDKNDNVIGYELYQQHPGDQYIRKSLMDHSFVSSDDCVLLFRPDRPGQYRGVPVGHSVMLEHKLLSQYELAQAHKQTVSALFAMYITTTNSTQLGNLGSPQVNPNIKYDNLKGERITPGTIQYLYPGEMITPSNPPKIDGYDEYTKNRLRKMARGWGLSYEVLSGDLSNVNFSSGRMGWIEMHRNIESWQSNVMIPVLCSRVWKWWMELAQLKGEVPLNTGDLRADWTPPRREMIDPVKETNAMIEQIKAGLKSWPGAIRELGLNPWKMLEEIKKSNENLDTNKLILSSDYRKEFELKKKPEPVDAAGGSGGDGNTN